MIEKRQEISSAKRRRETQGARSGLLIRSVAMAALALSGMLGLPGIAFAHGPTIKLSRAEMKPARLNLFIGTTVHFVNTIEEPGGQVVVDDSGAVESPPIEARGEGWHYTFEDEGRYELRLRNHPGASATIVVVPRKALPGHPPKAVGKSADK